jgi:(2Fe-2S) ferredoxin
VLVYPEGVLYRGVTPEDVAEIFTSHLEGGQPVERLLAPASVW